MIASALMKIVACTGVMESIESEDGRIVGVQWHPERLTLDIQRPLFDYFIAKARESVMLPDPGRTA